MTVLKASEAGTALLRLMDEAASSHEPVLITGEKNNAILLSEEDWRALQETVHLLSVPGMRESIINGMNEPMSECSEGPGW